MKSFIQIKTLGLAFLSIAIFTFSACKKDEPAQPGEIELAKKFVYDYTTSFYLWEDKIPAGIDYNNYANAADLFDAMYYPTLDRWSFVTDDYKTVQNSLDGVRKAAGYKFRRMYYSTTSTNFYGLVEYVHTDGEAFKAGLKRGDIIITVNGQILSDDNYQNLLYQDVIELGIGQLVGDEVVDLNTKITVTPIEQAFDPILLSKVIDTGSKKIGYFLYDQFIEDKKYRIVEVMNEFKSQNINELVLDLRYNPGGYVKTCTSLASMITSASNVDNIFIRNEWNAIYTDYWKPKPGSDSLFTVYFTQESVNLNLDRLVVLCSDRTASASEALANCLDPYVPVTLIGKQTHGKYTGAYFLYDTEEPPMHNWGLYLVVNKISNVNGVTDYINGLIPDFLVDDDYTTPLGDETEPLLAKALEVLTDVPVKSTKTAPEFYKDTKPGYENWIQKEGVMVQKGLPSPQKK